MNKNAIKKFAIEARKKLIDSVTDKAGMLGITEKSCSEPITEGADFEAVKAAAEKTLTTFFTGRLLGKAVRLAELGSRLYALEGVENYRFTAPAADVAADDTGLPVLGALTGTEMEA